MNAFLCLPRLVLKKAKIDREIYTISIASDLRGESSDRLPALGARNETLASISPPVDAAMKCMVVAVSNVFHHIDRGQPLSLTGDGIVLYPPADPQGMLALHFAVIESDRGARDLGNLLGALFGNDDVKSRVKEIVKLTATRKTIPAALLTLTMGAVATTLPEVLKKNKDDVLFSHDHSGLAFSSYGGSPTGTDYKIGNKAVECTLRVYARE